MMTSNVPNLCSGWNFGPYPQDSCTVAELVEQFYQEWGEGSIAGLNCNDGKPESEFLKLSIEKAIHQLGWCPRWSLSTTIQKTAQWYKKYSQNSQMNTLELCYEDINEYMSGY